MPGRSIKLFRNVAGWLAGLPRLLLGWSLPLFRIRGIQLSLHGSFLLLLAFAAWAGAHDEGWRGAAGSLALITAFFTCVVLHELGHAFAGRKFGVDVPRILLMPIGGMAEFTAIPRRPRHEVLMALAGPAVNLVIVAGLLLVVRFPPHWLDTVEPIPTSFGELGRRLLVANAIMGLFNLLPIFPMDGGRVLRALLACKYPYRRATFIAATIGKPLAVVCAWLMWHYVDNWLAVVLFAFIVVAGEIEYRAVRRREEEEEHWHVWWARQPQPVPLPFHAEPPR